MDKIKETTPFRVRKVNRTLPSLHEELFEIILTNNCLFKTDSCVKAFMSLSGGVFASTTEKQLSPRLLLIQGRMVSFIPTRTIADFYKSNNLSTDTKKSGKLGKNGRLIEGETISSKNQILFVPAKIIQ